MTARGPSSIVLWCLLAGAAAPAWGQARVEDRGSLLYLGAGLSHAAQRDQHASPLSYSGLGPLVELGFTRGTGAALLDIGLTTAPIRSTSGVTRGGLPYENALATTLRVDYYRRVHGGAGRGGTWLVGAATRAAAYSTSHHFDDPEGRVASYGLAIVSLGPAVMWRLRMGRGRALSARLGVPVAALAWRPYAEFRHLRDLSRRAVSVGDLRAAEGAVEYLQPLGGRMDLSVAYRLSALTYREAQPYARTSQALTTRLRVRLGGRRP